MKAITADDAKVLAILAQHNWLDYIETVYWKAGTVLVLDNWRLLHGRGQADRPDSDRKLLRISLR